MLATGYNGTPKGVSHCEEVGCLREQRGIASGANHELCRGIHAEQNAVVQAALYGVAMGGSTVYCTHQPCVLCAKILINAGVVEIVYADAYPDPLSEEMLAEAGVVLRRHQTAERRAGARLVSLLHHAFLIAVALVATFIATPHRATRQRARRARRPRRGAQGPHEGDLAPRRAWRSSWGWRSRCVRSSSASL